MAKGTVIGGKRGMLPPSGKGPIEVTREYLEEEERKKDGSPDGDPSKGPEPRQQAEHPPAPRQVRQIPSADAPRSEIIAAASQILHTAVSRYEQAQKKLDQELFREAGPVIRLVYATQAYKELVDPATGKPYRSFRKWAADEGISKSHAYRMVNEVPVMEALGGLYRGQLPAGHVDVLAPVLRQHGAEKLRHVWQTASAGAKAARDGGRPTVNDLVKARRILELDVDPEDTEPAAAADPAKTFKSVEKALRVLADTGALRLAMQHDPKAVRELVQMVLGTTEQGTPDTLTGPEDDA